MKAEAKKLLQDARQAVGLIREFCVGRRWSRIRRACCCVPIHHEDLAQGRWLKRNATHFVNIIVPRRPADGVFMLTRFG